MKRLLLVLILTAVSAQAEIYTWKDSKGTAHYTNSMVEIPARYKAKAKVLNLGPEQKDNQTGQPAGQPVATPAPAAPAPVAPGGVQVQAPTPAPVPAIAPDRATRAERRREMRRARHASEEE